MIFLFGSGSLRAKIRAIMSLTFQHARNLAAFVAIYKTLSGALRLTVSGGKQVSTAVGTPAYGWHAALAGGVGGWMVWANYSSVNFQIVM